MSPVMTHAPFSSENNLLILAFTNTSHGPDYTQNNNTASFSAMNATNLFKQNP